MLLSFLGFFLCFEQAKPSAILFHYTEQKADISVGNIFKTLQLTPEQSTWINSTTTMLNREPQAHQQLQLYKKSILRY